MGYERNNSKHGYPLHLTRITYGVSHYNERMEKIMYMKTPYAYVMSIQPQLE